MSGTVPSDAPVPSGAPRFPGIPAIVNGCEAIAYAVITIEPEEVVPTAARGSASQPEGLLR